MSELARTTGDAPFERPSTTAAPVKTTLGPGFYTPKQTTVDVKPRCRSCHSLLAEFVGRPWRFRCRKCKAITQSDGAEEFANATVAGTGSVA